MGFKPIEEIRDTETVSAGGFTPLDTTKKAVSGFTPIEETKERSDISVASIGKGAQEKIKSFYDDIDKSLAGEFIGGASEEVARRVNESDHPLVQAGATYAKAGASVYETLARFGLDTTEFGLSSVAGLAGIISLPYYRDSEEVTKNVIRPIQETFHSILSYEPRTKGGKAGTKMIHTALELLDKGADAVASVTPTTTGKTAVYTTIVGFPLLLGLKKTPSGKKAMAGEKLTKQEIVELESNLEKVGAELKDKLENAPKEVEIPKESLKEIGKSELKLEKLKEKETFETLATPEKLPEKAPGELPKFAKSINLEKQLIEKPLKEVEVKIAGELEPKKVQTWDETGKLTKEIVEDYNKSSEVLKKGKAGEALTAAEINAARQINVNALTELSEMAKTLSREDLNVAVKDYKNNIFQAVSDASSEAGRALQIHKQEISPQRMGQALSRLKRDLNKREFEEFKKLDMENPTEVQKFVERLGDPVLKDYVKEFWYNSILSGIPTHVVNIANNALHLVYQVPHRGLAGGVDKLVSGLTGKKREIFMKETVPMLAGYKTGFKKGAEGFAEVARTGKTSKFETKWERDIGLATVGAWERSPHKVMRDLAPLVTAPTRALRGMDVWANSIAYDAGINAFAKREGLKKGLKGEELRKFEEDLKLEHPKEMQEFAETAAKHSTFMDDPGAMTRGILNLREKTPGAWLVIPFVNTIANLTKRGLELTPGVGLTPKVGLHKGKTRAEIIAKQIEGSIIAYYIFNKIEEGKITGPAPEDPRERERFYASGKLPWSIKVGDSYYQYRRFEPFNTPIASTVIAYDKIKNAKDEETATQIFGNIASGMFDNILDSSYLSQLDSLLDKHRRKGLVQRSLASFVPASSFWRSINRSYEAQTEGSAKVRDTSNLPGAFSQTIPGLYDLAEPRLNVWGEEIELQGGMFRQWLPFKWSQTTGDPVEEEFNRLQIYPGPPGRKLTIAGQKIDLPDDLYREYILSFGKDAKAKMADIISKKTYQNIKSDEVKAKFLNKVFLKIRKRKSIEARRRYLLAKKTGTLGE